VNYVVQRTELLVSAWYLATLYSWIRAWDAPSERSRFGWRAAAVIACLLGMGSKEVIITVPLVLVLYDRAFRVESWRDAVSDWRRVLFYCLLAATSAVTIVFTLRSSRAGTVGFHAGLGWREYLYSQAWAILHYLRLAVWPDRLTFDYGQRPITGLRGVPGVVILGVAFIATSVAWIRLGRWAGLAFLGAWFFLLLAPSSSFVPIATEIAAERRIYLAFASVVTVVVIGATAAVRRLAGVRAERWATVGWVAIAALLTARTYMRSRTYANPEALWRDTVRNAPSNPRAYNNLASTLFFTTPPRLAEAQELYWQAIALDSTYLPPWTGLASAAVNEGRYADAKWMLEQALAIDSEYADAIDQLGRLYMRMGQPARAVTYLERFTKAYPSDNALMILASAYMQTGRLDAAALTLREALELNPARADALRNLGGLLTEQDRFAEATPLLERALALNSGDAVAMAILSVAYAGGRRADDAARAASQAVARAPGDANVQLLAGRAMLLVGRAQDADGYLSEAARLAPSNPEAITRLGFAKRALGNEEEAEKLFRRALAVDSGYAPARNALRK
jgi:tetratricopeptide (TPR) repeat protein